MATGAVIVGEAKTVIGVGIARVFEALVNPTDLAGWWSPGATIELVVGGRYESLPAARPQLGVIVALQAPRRLAFTWPMAGDGTEIETTVSYELWAHGAETEVHVVHRSPKILDPDRLPPWSSALGALKSYLEAEQGPTPAAGPDAQPSE